ncbi:MAG TPA: glycosyltransferase [Candidatus Sulfotelmatobacter sp.]|jgi:glycosyltransferase involved in cell wall biosynthesis|nr:glycosyltransferase [Candidatus Sulfotelmatobacter sp.]
MRVLHVIGSFPPATAYAGPPDQVFRLSVEMRRMGFDVRAITTNRNGPKPLDVPADRWIEHGGVPVFYGSTPHPSIPVSRPAGREIVRTIAQHDIVHLSTVYMWETIVAARAARAAGVPYVVSPRGCFDPKALVYSTWKKRLFGIAGGTRAFSRAAMLHVTAEMERGHVAAHVSGVPIRVVPNGVEVPDAAAVARLKAEAGPTRPDVVYLGRIHPKKNILALVSAWGELAGGRPGRLVIAGPDDKGHRVEVEAAVARLGLAGRVDFPGRVGGEAKGRLLSRARCLVLPSFTENFGNVVAEALAHGTPAVASTGTPWEGLLEHGCGWWVGPDQAALRGALAEVLAAEDARIEAMGERGRGWVVSEFAWPKVAAGMARLYEEVLSRAGGR